MGIGPLLPRREIGEAQAHPSFLRQRLSGAQALTRGLAALMVGPANGSHDLRCRRLPRRDGFYGLGNLLQGPGKRAIPKGPILRAECIETKEANQKPNGWRIHKEGKKDETGNQYTDELLHLRREAAIFQDNQGKGEGDRPAKPAPEHHRPKGSGHLLGEAKLAEQGQQTKDNEHPPYKGRRYQHDQPEPLLPSEIRQKPGHGQAHQKEDQGIGPEAKLLPGFVKPVPVLRR